MKRIDKIRALEEVFKTSSTIPLQKIKGSIRCSINLSDGTFTIIDGLSILNGQILDKAKFDEITKGLEIHRIIKLGKGIKPT